MKAGCGILNRFFSFETERVVMRTTDVLPNIRQAVKVLVFNFIFISNFLTKHNSILKK